VESKQTLPEKLHLLLRGMKKLKRAALNAKSNNKNAQP
jgi:hypothetical protein